MDCDELWKYIASLIDELDSRDEDFKKNKFGFDYGENDYLRHDRYYGEVQKQLDLANQVYTWRCGETEPIWLGVQAWVNKEHEPLGHPGEKPESGWSSMWRSGVPWVPIMAPVVVGAAL